MSSTTVSTKVPKELRDRIDEIAKLERRTLGNVVRMAIEQLVGSCSPHAPIRRSTERGRSSRPLCDLRSTDKCRSSADDRRPER